MLSSIPCPSSFGNTDCMSILITCSSRVHKAPNIFISNILRGSLCSN